MKLQLTVCALALVLAPLNVAGDAAAAPLGDVAGILSSIFGGADKTPAPEADDNSDNPLGIFGSLFGGLFGNLSEALDAYYNATAAINDLPLKEQKQVYAALAGTNTSKLTGEPLSVYQQYEKALAYLKVAEGPSTDYEYADAPEGEYDISSEYGASPAEARAIASQISTSLKGLGDSEPSASKVQQAVSQALENGSGRKLKGIEA